MDRVLQGLAWETCLYYLNNLIIFVRTWEELLQRLKCVLQRLQEAGLKLSPIKGNLTAQQVWYLGHQVSEDGIRPNPELLRAIWSMLPSHPPHTLIQKDVLSFLGLCSCYY